LTTYIYNGRITFNYKTTFDKNILTAKKGYKMDGKLLMIDSKLDKSRKLKVNLENIGYLVMIASNLNEAVLIAKTSDIDVLIIFEIDDDTRAIKDKMPLNIPVLGVFDDNEQESISDFKNSLDDYIYKPYEKKQLYLKINSLVRINRLQSQLRLKSEEIENLKKQLEKMNLIDKTTGLYNSFYLKNIIQHECASSKRYGYKLSGLAFSIDNKIENADNYDLLVKELIYIIKNSIRQNDTLTKLDSEGYYILLPHTGLKDAIFVAEKLRKCIDENIFKIYGHITISIGVASLNDIDTGIKKEIEMIDNAVEALEKAKSKGGNKVECY
jgi:diguanylate cyclase (GGDEF)-like protein